MKKIISSTVATILIFSFTLSASATSFLGTEEEILFLQSVGHGQYKTVSQKSNGEIIAVETEDEGVFHVKGNQYILSTEADNYLLVDKIDVNVDQFSLNQIQFNQYGIPNELVTEIQKTINKQKEIGNDKLEVAIYAPSLAASNQTENTTYYTYNGRQLRDYAIKYWHMSVSHEKKGTGAKDTASSIFNFIISSAGVTSKTISLFGWGVSALSAYESIFGSVNYGTQSDKIYINIPYDKITKRTEVYMGGNWNPGCTTYKAWLDRSDTYQYYSSTGKSKYFEKSLNLEYFSEHYNSAAATAIANAPMQHYDPGIRVKIYGVYNVL